MKRVFTKLPDTGVCTIVVAEVVKQWNRYCTISEWCNEYTLIERDGRSRERCKIKAQISKQQAHELIGQLDLVREQSPIFKSGATWINITT